MASASCVSPQQQFEYYQQKKQHQLCTPSAVELENLFNCKSTLNSQRVTSKLIEFCCFSVIHS